MSSLLLGDPTKSYFKLSLWREAAAWVERISAGDIILFKSKNNSQSKTLGLVFSSMDIQSHNIAINCRYQTEELAKRNCWYHNYVLLCSQSASAKEAAARKRYNYTFSHSVWHFPKIYPHFMCMSFPLVVKNVIPLSSLDSLMQWGRRHYGYLFDNPSLQQKSQSVFRSTKVLHECSSFL